jgi:hypothetical protein
MRQQDYMVTEERSRPIAGVGMDPNSDCRLQKPVLESIHKSRRRNSQAESPVSSLPVLNADELATKV